MLFVMHCGFDMCLLEINIFQRTLVVTRSILSTCLTMVTILNDHLLEQCDNCLES